MSINFICDVGGNREKPTLNDLTLPIVDCIADENGLPASNVPKRKMDRMIKND